jgi:hypothetical protein
VPQSDVFGFRGDVREHQFRRGAVGKPRQKMMFGKPYALISEPVGEHSLLKTLIESALDASFGHIRGFEFEKQTQFHTRASLYYIFE